MKKIFSAIKGSFQSIGAFFMKSKPFFGKIKAFFMKSKPFFGKIKAVFRKMRPFFDKISPFFKKYAPIFCRIALCSAIALFTAYTVIVITDTDSYVTEFFKRSAYVEFEDNADKAEELASKRPEELSAVAQRLGYARSDEDVREILSKEYGELVYFANGRIFDAETVELVSGRSGYEELTALGTSGAVGSSVYYNTEKKADVIVFYAPVRGSLFVDGVAATYQLEDIIDLASVRGQDIDLVLIMNASGKISSSNSDGEFEYSVGGDFREFIESLTHDNKPIEDVGAIIQKGKRGSMIINGSGMDYTVSFSPIKAYGETLWLVGISKTSGALSPELEYLRHIINICVIIVIALGVGAVYIVFYFKKKSIDELKHRGIDAPEGCPNKEIFKINASKLLQNRERRFALAVFEIRQFRYIGENSTEKEISELLEYIAKVIKALCNVRESYGYLGEGKFGLLIHIESDRSVKDRIRLIESVANKNALLGSSKSKRKFNIGISMTRDDARLTYGELLGYAEIACEKAKNNINVPYVVFTDQINSERMHNEQIEAEMETALANNEFRLFLQPKYNVEADRIDSAEALVRWFDTRKGDYRFPGEFIGLFESNGFITKLDHFMYIETLKYLSSAAERFEKIVPISVNVSMVTVSDPEFVDFYIENKNKYHIGDNFIVIEFTESFAMEDYQKIRYIVDTLHKNGIRCSLDDFGSGYSSLGTLKNIPFDELKFDRLFLSNGYDKKNDDKMLGTMFSLAKSMGIRVVQEGVETKEMFDSVIAKGCDVIQGYYYAKAIPVEEYRLFINSNTSIKYKSRVK